MGHLSTANKATLPVMAKYGFLASGGKAGDRWVDTFCSLLADILRARTGDKVFFNIAEMKKSDRPDDYLELLDLKNQVNVDSSKTDIIGVFKVGEGGPFFDPTDIRLSSEAVVPADRPFRLPLVLEEYYPNPVSEHRAFDDKTDPGELWNPKFNKTLLGKARTTVALTPPEENKLLRLLSKANDLVTNFKTDAYPGNNNRGLSIDNRLNQNQQNLQNKKPCPFNSMGQVKLNQIPFVDGNSFTYEKGLEAWLMEKIDDDYPGLEELLGPSNEFKWFGNYLPFAIGGANFDSMVIHERDENVYKITAIELKRDKVTAGNVRQVEDYSRYIASLLPYESDLHMIQPLLIGHKIKPEAKQIAMKGGIGLRRTRLAEYEVSNGTVVINPVYNPLPR